MDTIAPCESREGCLRLFNISLDIIVGFFEIIRENAESILRKGIYCDEACFVRNIRGINFENGEFNILENCGDNEEEVAVEVREKERLEILN